MGITASYRLFPTLSKPNNLILDLQGTLVSSVTVRTLPNVAKFCNVSDKTVQRAMREKGIITTRSTRDPGSTVLQRIWKVTRQH